MATLKIELMPFNELDEPAKARSRAVVHYQEVIFEEEVEGGDKNITSREASLSFDVSPEFSGQVEIADYVPDTAINLSLTSTQGMLVLSKDVDKPEKTETDDAFIYVWKLNKPEIKEIMGLVNRAPLYPSILKRQANFISIGFPSPPFSKYKLLISPIRQTEISGETLSNLFNIETFGTAAKQLQIEDLPELVNLPLGELIITKIGINGQFEFSVPVEGNESGWLWLLNGPKVFIGIQDEENLDPINQWC